MPTPDYPDYTLPIVVIGSVTVVGTVSITGTVTIEGTVTISGTVTVTGDVVVTGAVTVSTIAADNIVIDKLTVGAYIARTATLSNDNDPTPPEEPDFNSGLMVWGKFFPRGCRGHIHRLGIYCYRDGVGTITLSYAPQPGMGAVGSVTITPGLTWNWAWGDVDIFWNYDSLFIWISACSSVVYWGVNDVTPYDTYTYSAGTGLWSPSDEWRMLIRAEYTGLTAGDLPVSGTLNTVELPHASSFSSIASTSIPAGQEVTMVSFNGAGYHEYTDFEGAEEDYISVKVYCDGSLVDEFFGAELETDYGVSTPKFSKLAFFAGGAFRVLLTARYEFKRNFTIKAKNSGASAYNAWVNRSLCNLIR